MCTLTRVPVILFFSVVDRCRQEAGDGDESQTRAESKYTVYRHR